MSNTITDFVVGLGFDTADFDKGMKGAERSLDSFKSEIMQVGLALGSAFSVHQLTFGFAKQTDEARQFAQSIGLATDKYMALARGAESYGVAVGDLNGLLGQMAHDRASMAKGEFNYEALAITGVDWGRIHNAKDDVDAFVELAKQWNGLSKSQRINTASYYGLSPQIIDVLSQGEKATRELMATYADARPLSEDMEKAGRRFNASWALLEARLGGFSDRFAVPVTNQLSDLVEWVSAFADTNKEAVNSGIDTLGKHIEQLSLVVGASLFSKNTGVLAWLASLIGLTGKATTALGVLSKALSGTLVAGAFLYGEALASKAENLDKDGDGRVSKAERDDALARYTQSGDAQTAMSQFTKKGLEGISPSVDKTTQSAKIEGSSKDSGKTSVTIVNQIDSTPIGEMMLTFNRSGLESAVTLATGTTDR